MWLTRALVCLGALNWGLVGLFRVDVIGRLFGGPGSLAARTVYTIIGIAAVVDILAMATRIPARQRS